MKGLNLIGVKICSFKEPGIMQKIWEYGSHGEHLLHLYNITIPPERQKIFRLESYWNLKGKLITHWNIYIFCYVQLQMYKKIKKEKFWLEKQTKYTIRISLKHLDKNITYAASFCLKSMKSITRWNQSDLKPLISKKSSILQFKQGFKWKNDKTF